MKSPRQWSIRRMFLWVFVAALIFAQVSNLYHTALIKLDDFTLSDDELIGWLSKIDPSARADVRGRRSGGGDDEVHSEVDYWISADTAYAGQVISHLKECVMTKATMHGWTISGHGGAHGGGGDSFDLLLSKGVSRFRIYCWTSPPNEQLEDKEKNVFRLKVLQYGYTHR